jgi:hypothetical protein
MLADARQSCCVRQEMSAHKPSSNAQPCGEQVATEASTQFQYPPRTLSGVMDVHTGSIVVVRMIEGAETGTSDQ